MGVFEDLEAIPVTPAVVPEVSLAGGLEAKIQETLPSEMAILSRPQWGSKEFEVAVQSEHDRRKKAAEDAIAALKATGQWSWHGELQLPAVKNYVRFVDRHKDHYITGISEEPYAKNIGQKIVTGKHWPASGEVRQIKKKDQKEREAAGELELRTAPIAAESETK